ncbi:MAG: hypothetical protein E7018_04700 [Alphaproteobacteria bacterium]|nr:hypothetical protein [Alphaproteobacteria bacterium]
MNIEKNNCECREDDNCGCSFPNNIRYFRNQSTNNTKITKDSICICSPTECSCTVEQNEVSK